MNEGWGFGGVMRWHAAPRSPFPSSPSRPTLVLVAILGSIAGIQDEQRLSSRSRTREAGIEYLNPQVKIR
jgi:hypothetical protein